jgi:hypothetical protein
MKLVQFHVFFTFPLLAVEPIFVIDGRNPHDWLIRFAFVWSK